MKAHDPMDERLRSPEQQAVRNAVRDLPEDTPNMAWRSVLSDRIATESKRSRRRRWFLNVARPMIGLAVTASLATMVLLRGAMPTPSSHRVAIPHGSLEATLVRAHRESQVAFDVSGSGFGNDPLDTTPSSYDGWDESDVEAF